MKLSERFEALKLRKRGYSLTEISRKLNVSKSTVSLWVRKTVLSDNAMIRLRKHVTNGQLKASENKKRDTKNLLKQYYDKAEKSLDNIVINKDLAKIICALIYWCEGGKYDNHVVRFVNSDPYLVATFLNLFRKSYKVDESKFRVCIHLHSYHSEVKQKKYWSNITKIPKRQFIKTYNKPNTGKCIRENYQGCVSIRYYDSNICRDLLATGRAFIVKYRGVG